MNKYHAIELNLTESVSMLKLSKNEWTGCMGCIHFWRCFLLTGHWWLSFVVKLVDKHQALHLEIWKHQLLCTNSFWWIHCLFYVCIIKLSYWML